MWLINISMFVAIGLSNTATYHQNWVRDPGTCEDLLLILEIPPEVRCYPNSKLVYTDLPQDHPIDQVYTLRALDGIIVTTFASEGDPRDEDFDIYFSASLVGNSAISLEIIESLEDFGDYSEDGDPTKHVATSSNYRITYENESGGKHDFVIDIFQFFIDDVNNKPPEFETPTYNTSLREDWPVDLEIPDLKVKVRDRDFEGGLLNLTLDGSCPLVVVGSQEVTIIEGNYLEISFKLKVKLDHEVNPTVICTITATDGVNEGSTEIVITVDAGHDKPPKFDYVFYKIDVGTESPGEPLPVQPEGIHAVDQDKPPTEVTYTMVDADSSINGKYYFEIDTATADIKLIKELDIDFLNEYNLLRFVIYATDEIGDQDKAFLEINLPEPLATTVSTTSEITPRPTTTSATTTHEPSGPKFHKDAYIFQNFKNKDIIGTNECPGLFEEIGHTCYYFSSDHDEDHSWDAAKQFCQDMGTLLGMKVDLAEIGNEACTSDGLLMQKIANKGKWATWLGGSDEGHEASWVWVTSGRSLSIMDSFWYPHEPNSYNGRDEDCLAAVISGDYHRTYLDDSVCSNVFPFVCQIF